MNIEESIDNVKFIIGDLKASNYNQTFIQAIETLLTAYEKEKEKNEKIENELEKHIKFCEQEAEGSLHNEICHISLKFNKELLNILNEEE